MNKNLISKIITENVNKIDRALLDLSYAKSQSDTSGLYPICSAEEKLLSAKRNLLSLANEINSSKTENDEDLNIETFAV